MKDIEKYLIENDPLKGFERDMNTQKNNEAQNDSFETIEPDQDIHARREFEIGQLGNEELQGDDCTRDETAHRAKSNNKPSQENFNDRDLRLIKDRYQFNGFFIASGDQSAAWVEIFWQNLTGPVLLWLMVTDYLCS